ncbi:MipA/OmpV family protein [Pseudoalteromonas sp. MMG010]|uniref:MipA/OmpV family protein n=1 Tax=Pseudoalteromonas sp. MMG010 TaxID=2822685 RepID=UPI001B39F05E|nr:MipA/OmpV family protein [Pseudoalteromonas sp. MMG010]MBQ4833465.1 MipA/OmpV family protein [Pseudoalteromonas sp. MMG010]
MRSLFCLLAFCSFCTHSASKLEVGAGVFLAEIPHYLGSDQSEQFTLPSPYIRFSSDELDIDRSGLTGYLWQNGALHLDISAGFSTAVASEDSRARDGMEDLDWGLELGPALNYYLTGDSKTGQQLYASLFTRKAIATDFSSISDIGWRYGVGIYGQQPIELFTEFPLILSVKANVNFATNRYHDYFYTVSEQFSTPNRPVYNAKAGYSGSDLSLGLSYDNEQYWVGGFVKYYNISHASSLIASPLVKQHHNLAVGLGFAWKFYTHQGD